MFQVDLLFQTAVFILKTYVFCLDFHLQPLAWEAKSGIKDTNDFLEKKSPLFTKLT